MTKQSKHASSEASLHGVIQQHLNPEPDDSLGRYMANMPSNYWESLREEDFTWHLENLSLLLESGGSRVTPIIRWRQLPGKDHTEVLVCARQKHGLLAKITGAFAASGINVLGAEIFTRKDGWVLDVFRVNDRKGQPVTDEARMANVNFILTGSLPKHADLPFSELMERSAERPQDSAMRPAAGVKPRITLAPGATPSQLVLGIEAADYLGLLHDVLQVIQLSDLEVEQAMIATERGVVHDTLNLRWTGGGKGVPSGVVQHLAAELERLLLAKQAHPAKGRRGKSKVRPAVGRRG